MKTVAVIEGDGAAPEAVRPTIALLDHLLDQMTLPIRWTYPVVGEVAKAEFGSPFPDAARQLIDECGHDVFRFYQRLFGCGAHVSALG